MIPQRTSTYQEAGLPRITGYWQGVGCQYGGWQYWHFTGYPGAVTGAWNGMSDAVTDYGDAGGWGSTMEFQFDASRSNPIYGNSTTVQPSALTVNYFIRAK